jgi:glycosyltransferase involved in cell wall biosynthesis
MARHFPQATIYTLFHERAAMPTDLSSHRVVSSFLDRIPGAKHRHRFMLPLMPAAIRSLRLDPVDLVISSSHCVAKAVRVPAGAKHLSYVHAPLRSMWDRFDDYFGPGRASLATRTAAVALRPSLQAWDVLTASGVDRFVANSRHVASQIAERYHRHASVLSPPVEVDRFTSQSLEGTGQGGYFLVMGALAPYKRVDLAIDAFSHLGVPLWVAGSGQMALRNVPSNVRVLGQVRDDELPDLYRNARALIFPGVEDFGLTPLEAMATGRPVIAYRSGGVLDTVTPQTGMFFDSQTAEALVQAVREFDGWERSFSPAAARNRALQFNERAFLAGLDAEIKALG